MSSADDMGWAWFRAAAAGPDSPRDAESDIARAFARVFSGPEGEKTIAYLRSITMERTLGPQVPDTMLRHLEGQRQLIAHILGLIERGRNPNQGVQR